MANLFGGGVKKAEDASPSAAPGIGLAQSKISGSLKKRGLRGRAAALLVSKDEEINPATAKRTITGN